MVALKPLKLHAIIGISTEWTDELWEAALSYLRDRVGIVDVLIMATVLPDGLRPYSPHKIDHLREFQQYPPTLLIGAFDYMRAVARR
jgi:hypothetical protein